MSLEDIDRLAPGRPIAARIDHADGSQETIKLDHTLTADQIEWFWAGSALNLLREHAGS